VAQGQSSGHRGLIVRAAVRPAPKVLDYLASLQSRNLHRIQTQLGQHLYGVLA
jgi:hypothetical protein